MRLVSALLLAAVTCGLPAQNFSCNWSQVGQGFENIVSAYAVFNDGTGAALYAGGEFEYFPGGVPATRVVRWNGSAWVNLSSDLSPGRIRAMTVFDDGTGPALYVGGDFTVVGGLPSAGIARWDGTAWTTLGAGLGGGPLAVSVAALRVFDDGSGPALFVGGSFTAAGGIPALNLARWDGNAWTTMAGGLSGGLVSALEVYDNGSGPALYVGGAFNSAGGVPVNNIARWDGTAWSPLGAGVGSALSRAMSMKVHDDGTGPALYVGGSFFFAGTALAPSIARWDGTAWTGVGGGLLVTTPGSFQAYVVDLEVFDSGSGPALFATGEFDQAGLIAANNIAMWDGAAWNTPGAGLTSVLPSGQPLGQAAGMALQAHDDGTGPALYVGGLFSHAGGVPSSLAARFNACAVPPPPPPTTPLIGLAQPGGPGAPVRVFNSNLTQGREYLNLFSFTPCGPFPGGGPYLGLCAPTPSAFNFLLLQASLPLGSPVTRFSALSSTANWGLFPLAPMILEAVSADVTGGTLGHVGPVVRLTVQ